MIGGQNVPPAKGTADKGNRVRFGLDNGPGTDDSSKGIDIFDVLTYAFPIAAVLGGGGYLISRLWRQDAALSSERGEIENLALPENSMDRYVSFDFHTKEISMFLSGTAIVDNTTGRVVEFNSDLSGVYVIRHNNNGNKGVLVMRLREAGVGISLDLKSPHKYVDTNYRMTIDKTTLNEAIREGRIAISIDNEGDVSVLDDAGRKIPGLYKEKPETQLKEADALIKDHILPELSYGEEIRAHINENTRPSEALRDFLRGELGRDPTDSEVKELFTVMNNLPRSNSGPLDRIYYAVFQSNQQIFQILTEENLSNLATEIEKLVIEFREINGREPKIVEVAAGDGRLSRKLWDRGLVITATDNKSWEAGIVFGGGVINMDGVEAARNADIIVANWLHGEHPAVEIAKLLAKNPGKSLVLIGGRPFEDGSGSYMDGITESVEFWNVISDRSNRLTRTVPETLANLYSHLDCPGGPRSNDPTEASIIRSENININPQHSSEMSAALFTAEERRDMGFEAQRLGLETTSPEESRALRREASQDFDVRDSARFETRRAERLGEKGSPESTLREMRIRERDRTGKK